MSSIITRREALTAVAGLVGTYFTKSLFAYGNQYDGVSSATVDSTSPAVADSASTIRLSDTTAKVLLVLVSFHHKNTEKIAAAMAKVLNAQIKTPQQISIEELQEYDLIGFGSGIYDQKHHQSITDLVDKLSNDAKRRVFIYSTSGVSRKTCLKHSIDDPHAVMRKKLQSKDFRIMGEFNCAGWNTNSFLKLFGGINRSRPRDEDLKEAENFAKNLQ